MSEKDSSERASPEKGESWKKLIYEFTQDTTFHGVRFITAHTPYILRRLVWIAIVLSALTFFLWFMTDRLMYLRSNPKAVDVEVIYTDNVSFPSVTICNQNLFRASATQSLGLYDTVDDSFGRLQNGGEAGVIRSAGEKFLQYRDHTLHGMGAPHAVYEDTTAEVCMAACVRLHDDSCCSLLYNRATRACAITPLEMNSTGVKLVSKLYMDYYKRRKCEVQRMAKCSFEKDLCTFTHDKALSLRWVHIGLHEKKIDVPIPEWDHTTTNVTGRFLLAATKHYQPNTKAQLVSQYILAEDRTCVRFYHQVRSGVLSVLRRVRGVHDVIWSVAESGDVGGWRKANVIIPTGYYRLVMEARPGKTKANLNIALDDIYIGPCGDPDNVCRESRAGTGYLGQRSWAASGAKCAAWQDLPDYLRPQIWDVLDPDLTQSYLPTIYNWCRNPDDDLRGPWCFTHLLTGRMEYCTINTCPCHKGEYECANSRCVALATLCDGVDNCGDNSDEIQACNRTASVPCSFEGSFACGYETAPDSPLAWRVIGTDSAGMYSVNMYAARSGDYARAVLPRLSLAEPACVHVEYWLTGPVQLDIFYMDNHQNFNRSRLCSVSGDQGGPWWNATDFALPPGDYQLFMEAVFYDSPEGSVVQVDNITMMNENCTIIETEYHLLTTVQPTLGENMTTEMTTPDYSNWNDTGDNSTALPPITETPTTAIPTPPPTEIVYRTVHDSDEHAQCHATNTTCYTCPQPIGKIETCRARWVQRQRKDAGQYSDCQQIGGGYFNFTPKACQLQAEAGGANVVNYRGDQCYYKDCKAGSDLHLKNMDQGGGWDIYELLMPADHEGIPCSMEQSCTCGYRYVSSNLHIAWARIKVNLTAEGEGGSLGARPDDTNTSLTLPDFNHYLTVAMTPNFKPRYGDSATLLTPFSDITTPCCLRLMYYTRYVDLEISRYNHENRTVLKQIKHDGQRAEWHPTQMDLPTGYYGILVNLTFGENFAPEHGGLDDLTITPGVCYQKDTSGPFDCSFAPDDLCGYQDRSAGPITFLRSRNFNNDSPGGFYLRTSGLFAGKSSAVVLSPWHDYANISCVNFFYFSQSQKRHQLGTFSVTQKFKDGSESLVWSIRTVTDNNWHYAHATIIDGLSQIAFEISGDEIRVGLDDISVTSGECLDRNCSMDETKCHVHMACIGKGNRCDGMPNCYLGADEHNCVDDGMANQTIFEPDVVEKIATEEKDVDESKIGSAMTLQQMYRAAGHQGHDMFWKCKWEGKDCSYENFTEAITDFGLCYTFNAAGTAPLSTARTGSRFGLSVTMNIEQYEYMRGPQSDAGIKMFLHAKNELPEVRDLGFSIPPGVHALVAIRLNEAENLPAPWGDCGERKLDYYKDYTHARCFRDCETRSIEKVCKCRDAYMPALIDRPTYPPICNLTRFFNCAMPQINSVTLSDCVCPKPCQQTIYEPGLSQAALSVLSVDNILSENKDILVHKYRSAVQEKQRIDPKIFVSDLNMLDDVVRGYTDMRLYGNSYLGDFDKSELANLWTASNTLAGIFLTDINTFMRDMNKHMISYNKVYKRTIELLTYYIDDVENKFEELTQLISSLRVDKEEFKRDSTYASLINDIILKASLAFDNYGIFRDQIYQHANFTDPEIVKYLPCNFTVKNKDCKAKMEDFFMIFDTLKTQFELEKDEGFANFVEFSKKFKIQKNRFDKKKGNALKCLLEYQGSLFEVVNWKDKVTKLIQRYLNDEPFLGVTFNFTKETEELTIDEEKVKVIHRQYIQAKSEKLHVLEHFDNQGKTTVQYNINRYVNTIKAELTQPLRVRVVGLYRELKQHYTKCMEMAAMFESYLKPETFFEKSKPLIIWRKPFPIMETPERFDDHAREYWKVWNIQMDITTFSKERAPLFIDEGLSTFCSPLLDKLDSFEKQILEYKRKLLTSLDKIQEARKEYNLQRVIDHNFVLTNFLKIDVYFSQLKHQNVKQLKAYEMTQFLGDVGGYMGLLLGGSVLTVFEVLDLVFFHFFKNMIHKASKSDDDSESGERSANEEKEPQGDKENGDPPMAYLRPPGEGGPGMDLSGDIRKSSNYNW